MYKNRLKQIRWTTAAMYVYIITIVLMTFIFPEWIFKQALGGGKPQLVYDHQWLLIALMLGTALLLFFAKRFIIQDEKKVRKANRLR
jgi:membrane-bound acyltransferase YfiQ involved in biofilm formation